MNNTQIVKKAAVSSSTGSTSQQQFFESQMAETVKKSRIVSEDDLEESLMQEFNMRLKHCLSQEKVQSVQDLGDKEIYEEINSEVIYDVPKPPGSSKEMEEINITYNLTKNEDIYEEITPTKTQKNDLNGIENGHEIIYENVKDLSNPILIVQEEIDQNVEEDSKKVLEDLKSARDRMLLSTDDTSCLLFTQTVTSPMLTPSEENIDFLKGFRAENSESSSSKNEEKSQGNDNTQENISEKLEEDTPDNSEPIYENLNEPKPIITHGRVDIKAQCRMFIENEISQEEITEDYSTEENKNKNKTVLGNKNPIPDVCLEATLIEKVDDDFIIDPSSSNPDDEVKLLEDKDKFEEEIQSDSTETETIESDNDKEILTEPQDKEMQIDDEDVIEIPISDLNETQNNEVDFDDEKFVDNPSKLVDALKSKYLSNAKEVVKVQQSVDKNELMELRTVDIMKHITKFENKTSSGKDDDEDDGVCEAAQEEIEDGSGDDFDDSTETTETYMETTTTSTFETSSTGQIQDKSLKKKKSKKSRSHDKENISLKSSFNKFDALQKKNVLHVRSSDSSKAQEKFNGAQAVDTSNCKSCGKVVFQMEQIKAERSVWHKNCFRCQECNKQLTVDTYQSNEGTVYCKPHFKSLFAPKAVEDDQQPIPKKHELIIRENQPLELPPDVVRASDKPDLGLEELQSLNVRERFQVFENFQEEASEKNATAAGAVNVKRSPSILSKLAKFQAKGMDVGVPVESLNGIPIDESSSDEEIQNEEEEEVEGEDADLIRAKRVQKEKPFHFTGMSDVKSKWEHGEQNSKDERREERKQEIQTIRNRLFMGKQGKMKEAYQQAVMESESGTNIKRPTTPPPVEVCATKSIKEKFEKGEIYTEENRKEMDEDMSVFESGISKKSRSIFLELDANASKAPQLSPVSPPKQQADVKKAREAYMARQSSEDTVKSSEQLDDVKIETSDIQQRFKFFETYKEPEKERKQFRITPPRDGQQKGDSPDRDIYHDPEVIRADEHVEDSVIAKESHTTTKVLNKFRQMEENLNKEPLNLGPKPLKRFTPPPEPTKPESSSEAEGSESEEESESIEEVDNKLQDVDLLEAQKAARAQQLRAKFEKWEAKEIKREQQQVNIIEEYSDQPGQQIESTKVLRAKFESLKDTQNETNRQPKVKVNRFVDTTSGLDSCDGCKERIYPLEKITVHNLNYHKKCFKCTECGTILRMDSYTYNQGKVYCIPHFKRLFISKGNYDTAFGVEQRKEKWNATVA
nr:probable serine/threonine-protein kinase kinX isoform X14 [Onthophagus taurus]